MRLGFNITDAESYRLARELASLGLVSYFELLIDNFVHLSPDKIAEEIGGFPCAFHIMKSEFLECPEENLERYGRLIRSFIQTLKPIYVSDHLARFNVHQMKLPVLAEYSYTKSELSALEARTVQWQETLGTKLLIENFPSRSPETAASQPEFLSNLAEKSGCGILFDVSNALLASVNGNLERGDWLELAAAGSHFHVGGFRQVGTKTPWLLDSHDSPLSPDTFDFLAECLPPQAITLTYERDANLETGDVAADLRRILKELAQ